LVCETFQELPAAGILSSSFDQTSCCKANNDNHVSGLNSAGDVPVSADETAG